MADTNAAGTDLGVLPPRDPAFGPDALAGFTPQDPAAMVTKLNLNALNQAEAAQLLSNVNAAIADKQKQNDIFGALQVIVGFASKVGFL